MFFFLLLLLFLYNPNKFDLILIPYFCVFFFFFFLTKRILHVFFVIPRQTKQKNNKHTQKMSQTQLFVRLATIALLMTLLGVDAHFYHAPKRLNDFQNKHDLMEYIKKVNMHNANDWGRLGTTRFGKRSLVQDYDTTNTVEEEVVAADEDLSSNENASPEVKRALILKEIKTLLEELD